MSQTWKRCLNTLKNSTTLTEFSAWLKPLKAIESKNNISLLTTDETIFKYVKQNLIKKIEHATTEQNKNLKVCIRLCAPEKQDARYHTSALLPEYSFENLVLGNANQMAYGAAKQIASNVKKSPYNPFIIYGNSGLGKTHTMQAAGHLALQKNPKTRIIYMPLMNFVRNITTSLRHNTIEKLKLHYQSADLLLVDDIHLIAGKEKSQEEFFHIFNFLFNTKKQIIFTCDQSPNNIKTLEERIRTRLTQGLNLLISPPELEMRAAILLKKSQSPQININMTEDIALFIAGHITSNVRALEGCLLKIKAFINFSKNASSTVTKDLIEDALGDLIKPMTKNTDINDIQKETSKHYAITTSDLTSKTRKQHIVLARQIAIFISHELTPLSLTRIGKHFGNRDHSTVIHAIKKIKEKIKENKEIQNNYEIIKLKLANL